MGNKNATEDYLKEGNCDRANRYMMHIRELASISNTDSNYLLTRGN